jgi:hypothetical protein
MDWKAIAQAQGLNLPPGEIDCVTGPLAALEEVFRPLIKTLTPDIEPDPELTLDREDR